MKTHTMEPILIPATTAEEISRELRCGSGTFLTQRQGVVVLSLIAIGAMGVVSLYQIGVLRRLPDPPLPQFNSDKVESSPDAYKRLATPDGTLAVGSYAATLALAAMGGQDRFRQRPWIPLALAGKVGFDLVQVLRMLRVQWTKYRSLCSWCLVMAAATIASAPLVIGEAREALRHRHAESHL